MIVLFYFFAVNVNQLRYDRAIVLYSVVIEIRDVADYQVAVVFRDGIAYFEQPLDVFVMTGQFVKH